MTTHSRQPALSNVRPISGGPSHGDKLLERQQGPESRDLTDPQRLFLEWLCGGRQDGESQRAFAERVGIEHTQLSRWKRQPSFLVAWEERMLRTHANPSILSSQLAELLRIGSEAVSVKDRMDAIKLYWQLLEKMTPAGQSVLRDQVSDNRSAEDLSDEELAQILAEETA